LNDFYVIDALALARELFPGLGRYNLGNVARSLGIDTASEHRAMADVRMTLSVFKKELDVLTGKKITKLKEIAKRTPKKKIRVHKVKDYKISIIEKAIKEQKKLNITYKSKWSDERTERVITPRKLEEGYEKGYLIAFCHMRNADRVFLVEGIEDIRNVS